MFNVHTERLGATGQEAEARRRIADANVPHLPNTTLAPRKSHEHQPPSQQLIATYDSDHSHFELGTAIIFPAVPELPREAMEADYMSGEAESSAPAPSTGGDPAAEVDARVPHAITPSTETALTAGEDGSAAIHDAALSIQAPLEQPSSPHLAEPSPMSSPSPIAPWDRSRPRCCDSRRTLRKRHARVREGVDGEKTDR